VTVSEDPLTAVVLGAGRFLEELKDFPAEEM
jgi:actin-like ATPase involved in cell morphogenesis